MKTKKNKAHLNELRYAFFKDLDEGNLSDLFDTIRRMRKITGLTQPEYAKLIGIAPRVLIDIERGVGNPTLKTLNKIAEPFGLRIGLLRRNKNN
jgi:DNA-binding XRE family transcriptional regulator